MGCRQIAELIDYLGHAMAKLGVARGGKGHRRGREPVALVSIAIAGVITSHRRGGEPVALQQWGGGRRVEGGGVEGWRCRGAGVQGCRGAGVKV